MDQLLKKKFDQFQAPPPESVWSAVKSGIPVSSKGAPIKLFASRYFLALIAASVIVLGVIFLPGIINKESINDPELNRLENIVSQKHQSITTTNTETKPEVSSNESELFNTSEELIDPKNQQTQKLKIENQVSDTPEPLEDIRETTANKMTEEIPISISGTDITENPSNPESKNYILNPEDTDPLPENSATNSYMTISSLAAIPAGNLTVPDTYSSIQMIKTSQTTANYGPLKSSKWDLGLFYFREWIYYPEDKDQVEYKNSQSVEITGRYHFSEFFIQSGLGIAFSEDDGNCRIDYNTYELAGTYEDVYDVTFDTTNHGMTPVFHTQTIEVYDTLNQKMYTPMDHKYTYIQIPLLFGFEQSISGRFFYNLKLGPLMAIMVGENESDIDYPTGNIDITDVYVPLPTRVKTSWQFILGVGLGYNISNHVSLSVEPAFKYYLGSGYKSTDMATTHPYSLGLRGGITYRF